MIDPFDTEFLSQELRDSWKKIEELEKENKNLKLDVATAVLKSVKLEKENKELKEQLRFYKRQCDNMWDDMWDDDDELYDASAAVITGRVV